MLDITEQAAAILQARMSWPEAERCADSLSRAGWASLTQAKAAALLEQHLRRPSAQACAEDLVTAGLIPAPARRG
jgi:hypothetical protein